MGRYAVQPDNPTKCMCEFSFKYNTDDFMLVYTACKARGHDLRVHFKVGNVVIV